MSWFLNEINEAGNVRLCMEDGRLIYGHSVGVDTKSYPASFSKVTSTFD